MSTRPPRGYDPRTPQTPQGFNEGSRRRASLYAQQQQQSSRGGGGGGGGGGANARKQWFKRYGPWIALLLATLISGVFGYILWTLRDIPDPGKAPALAHTVTVLDRKGRTIEQRNASGQFYQRLTLAEMGDMNKYATLAAEDRDFYQHPAIDVVRTSSAAVSDILRRGNLQGGSTITQQLVKISVLTPQRSVFRKMQEATLAFGLESQYSKDQILEMYLNRVFYGHNAYGIGAATKVFFGSNKDAKDLTPGQSAFLAALINGPSYYDPLTNYDRAKDRQLYVLDGMVKKGWLTQADADKAAQENIKAELKFDQAFFQSKAPHFVNYVIGAVEQALGADAQQGDLTIQTTLDLDLQDLAQRAVSAAVANPKLRREGVNNADLLAARPDTGEILAWIGSADFRNDSIAGQVDVVQQHRQPGSSFKPYVFEAALKDRKITLATTLHDRPTDFGGGYKPLDYDNTFMGDISARRALVLSRNVPAVETARDVGMDEVIKEAHAQGIKSDLNPTLGTSIGASEVTMLEHLQGYQVFANQGTLVPLMSVTKVTNAQNDVLYQQQPGTQQGITKPLTPAEAYLITDTLKDYSKAWNLGWRREMAGKSGTTGGSTTGIHRDAWMMGYNPDIVVGAWAGNTAPNTVNGGAGANISTFGTEVGQTVLAQFINGLPDNMKDWYRRPDGLVSGNGCPGDRTNGGSELFLPGTQSGIDCPTPTPTPTPSATPTPQPTPSRTPRPSSSPLPLPSVTPLPTASVRITP